MGSRNIAIVVGAIVLVVVIVAGLVWTSSYNSGLVRDWSEMQQSLSVLDTRISGTNCDFADIDKSARDLKSRVDTLKLQISARSAPPFSSRKQFFFLDFLTKTSETLASISVNCSTWSAPEISRLEQASESLRKAQTACSLVLGVAVSRSDVFVSTASTFNKMRQARKKVTITQPAMVVVGGLPTGFVMPTDPYLASYVSQMRSLLREYKGLRSGLDRYIDYVKRTGQSLEGSAYTIEFDLAIAARQSVLNRINEISPPAQYLSQHQAAAACVRYGIDAMCALKRGDYPSFHSMSQQNTPRLSRIRSVYGF